MRVERELFATEINRDQVGRTDEELGKGTLTGRWQLHCLMAWRYNGETNSCQGQLAVSVITAQFRLLFRVPKPTGQRSVHGFLQI